MGMYSAVIIVDEPAWLPSAYRWVALVGGSAASKYSECSIANSLATAGN